MQGDKKLIWLRKLGRREENGRGGGKRMEGQRWNPRENDTKESNLKA